MGRESKSGAPPFSHELRVRYSECDAQGIVFNAHYLAYVDIVLTEIWREAFGSYAALLVHGVDTVVAESNLRFRSSARFDDLLRIEGGFDGLGRTSTVLRLRYLRDEELLTEIEVRYVFVSTEDWGKRPIPTAVRERLEPFLL